MRMKSSRTEKWAWIGVVGLTAILMVLVILSSTGVMDVLLARRLIGVALGLTIVNTGNLLPKLRPFGSVGGAAAIERFSGWLLALAGLAWVALFALAPLPVARQVAGVIGVVAMAILALRWGALAWTAWSEQRRAALDPAGDGRVAPQWGLTGWLLFAFFYALIVACLKFLVDQPQLVNELSMWVLAGFWLLYTAVSVTLGAGTRRRSC